MTGVQRPGGHASVSPMPNGDGRVSMSTCETIMYAIRRQHVKILLSLQPCAIAAAVAGVALFLPAALLRGHPLWWGVLHGLVFMNFVNSTFDFIEFGDTPIGWATLKSDFCGTAVSTAAFFGISLAMGLWGHDPMPHMVWAIPATLFVFICVATTLDTRSAEVREDRAKKGLSLAKSLSLNLVIMVAESIIIYTTIGVVFVMNYITDPTIETLVVSIAYPLLKTFLDKAVSRLLSKTLPQDDAEEDEIMMRSTHFKVLFEISFGLAGKCTAAMLPWPGYLIATGSGMVTEVVGDYIVLWKALKGGGVKQALDRKLSTGFQRLQSQGSQSVADALAPMEEDSTPSKGAPTPSSQEGDVRGAGRTLDPAVRRMQETLFAYKDFADKITALLAPILGGLLAEVVLGYSEEVLGEDVTHMRDLLPGWPAIGLRVAINMVTEATTDVSKNAIFWRAFQLLPATCHLVLPRPLVALVSSMTLSTFGLVLAGSALATHVELT
mmetsp:Transcript_28452/g.90634  ORF Transcript_28452/g.90634 Transcript_28452/m.90634 type:complete len:495 (-) Transcript_28452:1287-2771(-)